MILMQQAEEQRLEMNGSDTGDGCDDWFEELV